MQSNPILASSKYIFSYFFVWLVITSAYIQILVFGEKIPFEIAFADGLVFNTLLAGLGLSYWFSAKYISVELHSVPKIFASHFIGSLISVTIWLSIGYIVTNTLVNQSEQYWIFFLNSIGWRTLIGALYYFLVVSFYYLIIYYNNFHAKTLRENELKNLVTQAELRSLKFQINPHFIFNSLNSMSALTTIDPVKARNMILKLAEFLRYTLVNNDQQKNKLSEELNNIKLYLEIEKIRFEEKFDFVDESPPGCQDALVPNMILQPLFENAIKHAVYESLEKVILKFKCSAKDDFLNISLENNFDSSNANTKGSGIGLKNIAERLKLIYGLNNLMNVEKSDGRFKVNLYIPLSQ